MVLIKQINKLLYDNFGGYRNVEYYFLKWQTFDSDSYSYNFEIFRKSDGFIDSEKTLHCLDQETLMKIAGDLGIETPYLLPSIPVIKNKFKDVEKTAFDAFSKSLKQIEENPDLAITLANSTLESIVKSLLVKIGKKFNKKDTLYTLSSTLLEEFKIFPKSDLPVEIKTIGSRLLSILENIEKIRSEKTASHGKLSEDYLVNENLYAYFIVNSVSTIGLFLINFYEKKYHIEIENEIVIEEMPF